MQKGFINTVMNEQSNGHTCPRNGGDLCSGSDSPISICLLGLTFDSPNLGVGALLDGSLQGILTCYPHARLSVLDYGYESFTKFFEFQGRSVPVEFVNLRFSKQFYLENNVAYLLFLSILLRYLAPESVKKYFIERNRTLRHISKVDTVASIAGGDSFSDIYGLSRLIYEALPQVLVLMMGKRLVLLPQTLGPFRGRIARRIAKFIMSRASLICSRDNSGMIEAHRFVDDKDRDKIRFCNDVGFLLEPRPTVVDLDDLISEKTRGTCIVGLNISGLLYAGGYNGKNMFGLKTDYKQIIERLVVFVVEKKGASILLVPHVYPEPTSVSLESDQEACKRVYEEFKSKYDGRVRLLNGKHTPGEIKYVIGMCDVFIGSRMHSCIAALSQSIPAVAISYSDKFAGVMEILGVSDLVADPREMGLEEMMAVVGRALDQRQTWGDHLSSVLPELREQTIATFKSLVVGDLRTPASHSLIVGAVDRP